MVRTFFVSLALLLALPVSAWADLSELSPVVAAIDHDNLSAVQDWLKGRAEPLVRIQNKRKESLIDRAVTHASIKVFHELLKMMHEHNPKAELRDARGTPVVLTLASLAVPGSKHELQYESMIKDLIKVFPHNAVLKDRAYIGDGRTALHQASSYGNLSVMKLLVNTGAKVGEKNSSGELPLHLAARFGRIDAVKYLVAQGSPLNEKSKFTKTTPLMSAAEMGHELVIRFLLLSGAKKDERDVFGKTAPERFKEYTVAYYSSIQKLRTVR